MTAQTDGRPAGHGTAASDSTTATAASSSPIVPRRGDSALSVPQLPPDCDVLTAALAYADAGWFVFPIEPGQKRPAKFLGDHWQHQSSRDHEQLVAWYAGTSYGIGLHAGRSGALVADVDHPEAAPAVLREHLDDAPYQATRANEPGRGHYFYAQPPGRRFGNSTGGLGKGWGELRGMNGYVVAYPSEHPAPGGQYAWLRTGPVPLLPQAVASLLPDAEEASDAATDAEIERFLADHTASARPELLEAVLRRFAAEAASGSRHEAAVSAACWATREARAGLYPARPAAEALREAFTALMASGAGGARRLSPTAAAAEFAGILAWAVAQARGADVATVRTEVAERLERPTSGYSLGMAPRVPEQRPAAPEAADLPARRLVLTSAAQIKPRRVRWLWEGRIAIGTLALLAGPEGLGKSTLGYWLAAQITRGTLPGEDVGRARSVLVCATEDSWEHTIVPRLIAAGADLERVYRVEVVSAEDVHLSLSLPRDLLATEAAARQVDASLLLLDPLMSRLDGALDTHKDAEVRLALEPLTALADRANLAVLGLIHHNKSGSSDPLQAVMASRAFTAVARSVHTVIRDPDDDTEARRLFGTPKNNLGRTDLPTLAFTVEGYAVPTDDGPAWTGRLVWGEEFAGTIRDAMSRTEAPEDRSATAEAADWLHDYLTSQGGEAAKADIEKAARAAGHNTEAVRRARQRLHLDYRRHGFPSVTLWALPTTAGPSRVTSRGGPPRGDTTTDTTDTTGADQGEQEGPEDSSRVSRVSRGGPQGAPDTTGTTTGAAPAVDSPGCTRCGQPRSEQRAAYGLPTCLRCAAGGTA